MSTLGVLQEWVPGESVDFVPEDMINQSMVDTAVDSSLNQSLIGDRLSTSMTQTKKSSRRFTLSGYIGKRKSSSANILAGKASVKSRKSLAEISNTSGNEKESRKWSLTAKAAGQLRRRERSRKKILGHRNSPVKSNLIETWQKTVSEDVLRSISIVEKRLQESAYEVTNSENSYALRLEHLLKVYAATLESNNYLSKNEVQAIFANLDKILFHHQRLDRLLTDARSEQGISTIGEIYSAWFKSWEMAREYGEYCANLAYAKHVLRAALQRHKNEKNEAVSLFMQHASELKFFERQSLEDLLDLPRRRLARYPLLLTAVLKHSNGERYATDARHLAHAAQYANAACQAVNTMVAQRGRDKLVSIQESIDFAHSPSWCRDLDLIEDNEPLVMDAEAMMKDGKMCHVYLFQHLLLVTKMSKSEINKMVVVTFIRIDNIEVSKRHVRTSSFKAASRIGRAQSFNSADHVSAGSSDGALNTSLYGLSRTAAGLGDRSMMQASDDASDSCSLAVRNGDTALQRNTRRVKIQRAASNSGKAHVITFSTPTERDSWYATIESVRDAYTGEGVFSSV
eukprot:m.140006 g.140006  ORF g.140006 m.140006 type:complete len:569 (-) comp17649_c0_seq1:269-1975(-)